MEQRLDSLIQEAKYELFHYPQTNLKQDVKYLLKRWLKPRDTPPRDSFFWTHAMLAQALESVQETEALKRYYDNWIGKGLPIYNPDNVMNGFSLLYVYEKTKDVTYRQAADRLYEYIFSYQLQMGNTMPYRKQHPTHVYVDCLGMVVPFLCRYGSVFEKPEAAFLGVRQLTDFLQQGMEEDSGLPYHGYDTKTKVKQGIIGWGRGVGWLMLALADSIEYLPSGSQRERMEEALGDLIKAAFRYLRKDGYFSWQLRAMEGPKDTSATAMIGYGLKKALKEAKPGDSLKEPLVINGGKDRITPGDALEQIRRALLQSCKNGKVHDCSGECEGFSCYPQIYGAYPWSLAPAVRCLMNDKEK